ELRGVLEHLGGDLRAAADDQRVEVADDLAELLRRQPGLGLDVQVRLLAESREPFGSERVGQENAMAHASSSAARRQALAEDLLGGANPASELDARSEMRECELERRQPDHHVERA